MTTSHHPPDSPDEIFMRLAIREASKGIGKTSPNPAVGAVIVRETRTGNLRVIGKGWHRKAGEPHAEVEAIRSLKSPELAKGATIYVTLEPCSTHGRTPPCVQAILNAGFKRVVIGTLDPNPAHAGRAIPLLEAAGVEITHHVLEKECRKLNVAFNHWIVTGKPWVIAKAGISLDGQLARPPEGPRWLTNAASRRDTHRLRAQVDAILIGGGTLRADNPRLTIRGVPHARQPWRVVSSHSGNVPKEAHLFTDEHRDRTLLYTGKPLAEILADLGRKGVTSVMLEGGSHLFAEAFEARLVHQVWFYMAPLLLGGGTPVIGGLGVAAPPEAPRVINPRYQRFGNDVRLIGEVVYPSLSDEA